ncbi:MAG: DUF1302 domain-containing protein [Betaproteobacteria bacterium]|nr:DUF1302 domain-containing protein [Betaproteobacteria bacterium]
MKKSRTKHFALKQASLLATTVALAGTLNGEALAFEIDSGNPDIEMRWDNTVRYNIAQRTQGRNGKIANSPNFDEGTYRFDKHDIVSNRLDILSEFDFTYKKQYGFRVSAAGWYDAAYDDGPNTRPNSILSNIGSYPNNKYSGFTDRFYHGPSGEIMDAFVFANVDAGSVPVKLKAGRHTVVWGESLFLGGAMHGIQYSQTPLDLQKGFATPGVEAKELFRPLNQISGQAQLTENVSVAAQYFLDWEPYRFPEGGTYLGPVDPLFFGPKRALVNPALAAFGGVGFTQKDAVTPDNRGEFGLSARWAVKEIDTNIGFYYRNFADKIPQVLVTRQGTVGGFPVASRSDYRQVYADDIDLYGISFAKNIAGISFGAEISHRRNTPLVTPLFQNVSGAGGASHVPQDGETFGARGNTTHALVNALGVIAKTPVFDAATWAVELTWAKWNDVTKNKSAFQAEGYAAVCSRTNANVRLAGSPKWTGCVTDDYWGIALAFNPTWYQVFSGVDLSMPLTYSQGLSGNAPTIFGGNEDLGNYSVGVSADVFQKHRVDLKYNQYFGNTTANAAGNAIATQNGFTSLLKDRGFLALTYKTTF